MDRDMFDRPFKMAIKLLILTALVIFSIAFCIGYMVA